jgi:hypothetical protein
MTDGSCFDLNLLEDINNPANPWSLCILGMPYGTSYWQVGDSSQQNGSFKLNIGKAKTLLLTKKSQANLPYAIEKYDIISIVNSAWRFCSFAKIGSNRHAISEPCWGPLNNNYLLEA